MDVYTRNVAVINVPYVDSIINFSAVSIFIIRESITFSWVCYFRIESIYTLRILILGLNSTFLSLITTLAFILSFFGFLVKYMSSYFFGLNLDL
jgi:hypothetical protein